MSVELDQSVVLITGASSGIGAGCAVELAKHGCRLSLAGRSLDRLRETAQRCRDVGLPQSHLYLMTGDVTVKEDASRMVNETVSQYGRLDVLLNNAGATRARNVETCTIEDLDWVYNVLVRSVFLMSRTALPHLEKTKGAIINMSSLAGLRPLHYALPYSMCKGMVDRYTQILAVAAGNKGVRCNSVNPAAVMTDMFTKPDNPGGAKYLDWCRKAIPLGRIGEVDEVARLVVFLASPDGKFLNGTNFPIDGSYSNTSYIPKLKGH